MAVKLRIKELRTQRGLTQEQLAFRLGMSLKGYQYFEDKATSIGLERIDLLCEELKCSPGDLFERFKSDNNVEKQNRLTREKRRHKKSEQMKQRWSQKRQQQFLPENDV